MIVGTVEMPSGARSPSHVNQVIYLVPIGNTLVCVRLESASLLAAVH